MFDTVNMKIMFDQLMSLANATTPHHRRRGSKLRKIHKRIMKPGKYTRPHQNHREITRHRRQLEMGQLDFTASGQMEIKGRKRLIREAEELSQ